MGRYGEIFSDWRAGEAREVSQRAFQWIDTTPIQ